MKYYIEQKDGLIYEIDPVNNPVLRDWSHFERMMNQGRGWPWNLNTYKYPTIKPKSTDTIQLWTEEDDIHT